MNKKNNTSTSRQNTGFDTHGRPLYRAKTWSRAGHDESPQKDRKSSKNILKKENY